ncbi:MAG: NUDIX hydrolase [Acidimicrobiia bacterium]
MAMRLLGWSDLESRSVPVSDARKLLASFDPLDAEVRANRDKALEFLLRDSEPYSRSNTTGHMTASSLVVEPDSKKSLLVFHPYFKRWQQTGGHAEGDHDLVRVALKEAIEETGLQELRIIPKVIDVGVGRGEGDIDHVHYDVRFLVISPSEPEKVTSPEGLQLRWFALNHDGEELDAARKRMLGIAQEVLAQVSP